MKRREDEREDEGAGRAVRARLAMPPGDVDEASGTSSFFVGSYATCPKEKALEGDYLAGLAALPLCCGLELGATPAGELNFNHQHDEAWLFGKLGEHGAARNWGYIITAIPGTMIAIASNPHFGLASDDEGGRKAAVEMCKHVRLAVGRLNEACGAGACKFVEVHAGPTRHSAAAKSAGASSSAKSLATSLTELLGLDWHGARLVVEHVDWHGGVAPIKGFLSLEEELDAIRAANAAAGEDGNKALVTINWARTVLETREASNAIAHITAAKEAGLLGGVMFSGCTGQDGPFGPWADSHMPHAPSEGSEYAADGSLMTEAEIQACVRAAGGLGSGVYMGGKITATHMGNGDVGARVGLNRDLLSLIAKA